MKNKFTLLLSCILFSLGLTAQTCAPPTNITFSNITPSSVDITWTDTNMPAATIWDIEIVLLGNPPTGFPQFTTNANPYTITGLNPNTTYCVYIRSFCSSTSSSAWTVSNCFSTPSVTAQTCAPPINITFSNTTASTMDVSWVDTNSPSAASYDMEIVLAGMPPTGTPVIPAITSNPYTLSGLMPNTVICVYMRSVCSANNTSSWTVNPACATTLPVTCQSPASFMFSNQTPTTVDLSWTTPSPAPIMWELEVGPLGFTPSGIPTDTSFTTMYTDSNLTPGTAYCAYIRGHCSPTNVTPWSTTPLCFATTVVPCQTPTNITFSNITTNSADMSWVDNNTPAATLWDLEIGPPGFTPTGIPTVPGVNLNPSSLSSLASNTTLCAYIRSSCSSTNQSPWTATPVCFTTLIPNSTRDFTTSAKQLVLFPNPSTGTFSIQEEITKKLNRIIILDTHGRIIKEITYSQSADKTIRLNNVSPGIYFCKMQLDNQQIIVEKIVIQ